MAKDKKEKPKVDDETKVEGETPEGEGAPAPKKRNIKKLLMFVVAPAVLVLGGGFFAFTMFFGGDEEAALAEGEAAAVVAEAPPVFYDLPEMLVNLSASGRTPAYLKLAVSLELDSAEAIPLLEPVMPRVTDSFQVFLRELRIEDLNGSAGMFRLKEELLRRVNLAVAPVAVKDVLFKEMLIQ